MYQGAPQLNKIGLPVRQAGWRRILFSLVVLAYVGWLAIITMLMFLPVFGWLPDNSLSTMGHFGEFLSTGNTHNLIHELTFAFIIGTAGVGLLLQLQKPHQNIAGQLIALIVWGAMIVTAIITNTWVPQPLYITFGGLALLATILHPAGRNLFTWFSFARIDRTLFALVVVAAVPLLVAVFINTNLQITGGTQTGLFSHEIPSGHGDTPTTGMPMDSEDHDENHAAQGHYRNMAAFNLIIILVALLASFKPPDWRLAAWTAGMLPILFGLISIVLPEAESSLGTMWSVAAIMWGFAFITIAEVIRHKASQRTPTHPNPISTRRVEMGGKTTEAL